MGGGDLTNADFVVSINAGSDNLAFHPARGRTGLRLCHSVRVRLAQFQLDQLSARIEQRDVVIQFDIPVVSMGIR